MPRKVQLCYDVNQLVKWIRALSSEFARPEVAKVLIEDIRRSM